MRKAFPVVIVAGVFLVLVIKQCSSPGSRDTAPSIPVADFVPEDTAGSTEAGKSQGWPPLRGADVAASPSGAVNYYIVFDGSRSMLSHECGDGVSKLDAAKQAVKAFIDEVPATANIGLAAFDRLGVSQRVALGVDNRDVLRTAVQNIEAGTGTPLNSGISVGYSRLTDQARRQLGYGEYHLIVVTDGRPEPRSEDPTPVVRQILSDSPVVLHTIGFCIDSNHVLNQQGRTYYASATSPQELKSSLQAVLAEAPSFDISRFQ